MIIQKITQSDEKAVDRFNLYKEVEKIDLADKKVIIKEFAGTITKEECEADISNLENSIADLTNQLRDKEALLTQINK